MLLPPHFLDAISASFCHYSMRFRRTASRKRCITFQVVIEYDHIAETYNKLHIHGVPKITVKRTFTFDRKFFRSWLLKQLPLGSLGTGYSFIQQFLWINIYGILVFLSQVEVGKLKNFMNSLHPKIQFPQKIYYQNKQYDSDNSVEEV